MYIKDWHTNNIRYITAIVSFFVLLKSEADGSSSQSQVQENWIWRRSNTILSRLFVGTQNYGAKKKAWRDPSNHCACEISISPKFDTPYCSHLITKNVSSVMDEDPAQPPARNQPALSQPSTGQDGDIAAERGQRLKLGIWEHLRKRGPCYVVFLLTALQIPCLLPFTFYH